MTVPESVTIHGSVDSVTYRNDDNGFAVIILDLEGEPLTVVGELGNVEEGEELELTGEYSTHSKFGKQFKASVCLRSLPEEVSAIRRYLAGGVVKGIGPVTAANIVKKFGERTFEVLQTSPEELATVEGVTPAKAKAFCEEFQKVIGFREVLEYFSSCHIPAIYGIRAWKKYEIRTVPFVKDNPYILCSYGIELPFLMAEDIAKERGLDYDNANRLRAGIKYVLQENANAGHTCLPQDRLVATASQMLRVEPELILQTIQEEIDEENLYYYYKKERPFVMLREYYVAEDYISRRLAIMNSLAYDSGINYDEVIDIYERSEHITYAEKQRKAINIALSRGFMVLTGGPGTGKTTTLNAMISLFEQQGLKPLLCAPTGRAAKRISDLTGYEAKTVHRLLGVKGGGEFMGFEHDENNMLDCDVVVVDEMSMVDTLLFEALLRALPVNCKMIMVGDSDQLPSVGAGNVLRDIIDSDTVPVISLNEIFRQAQTSVIITNAHKIVKGDMIDLNEHGHDFFFMQRLDFEDAQQLTVDLCCDRLPKAYKYSPTADIQVLSPTRKGPLGTSELNKLLQQKLNPPSREKSEIKTLFATFRLGDKVMQTKNDYDVEWTKGDEKGAGVFNGDVGIITKLNRVLGTIEIDFEGRICKYTTMMLENLELAYAVTVHKSQGSEFEAVILPILGGYDKLYYRNLLYTAVTRAKKLLVIVGSANRVKYMIDNNRRTNRYTCLKNMLCEDAFGNVNETDEII